MFLFFPYVLKAQEDYGFLNSYDSVFVQYTVIRYVPISAKFGVYTIVGLNVTLHEATIRTWYRYTECASFSFNKYPI
jgi:hypothetical protein